MAADRKRRKHLRRRLYLNSNGAAQNAMVLLTLLRRLHFEKPSFFCANEFRRCVGWSLPKFQLVRKFLINNVCLLIDRHASGDNGRPFIDSPSP